ncbi:unnamed protein product [Malus baccata var. baccata]
MLSTELSSVYQSFCDGAGVLGNIFAFGLYLSPLSTFNRIIRNRSTEQFSGMPYIYGLLNCLICCWYGMPIVKNGIILVATVNSVGTVFQLVYLSIFISYAERALKMRMLALLIAVFVLFVSIVVVSLSLFDYNGRQLFVGYLSIASLIFMYGSPLIVINLVIKTKSVEFMPFNLSFATFLVSFSFTAYGVFKMDPFLYMPNGIGTMLALVQLVLYCRYKNPSEDDAVEEEEEPLLATHPSMLPTGLFSVYLGWSTAAGIAGNIFAFVLFVSPIPTFKRIVKTKSTEQFSGLPYIYALLNCLICSWYGMPAVKTGIILVATVNSIGAVFQLVYLSIFIRHAERAIKLRMMGLIAAVIVVFAFVVFVTLGLLDYDERQTFVGYLSVASLISMFASPLFIIVLDSAIYPHTYGFACTLFQKLVIKTRSVEFMPFNLSLATFLMSLSFSAYGQDVNMPNPNFGTCVDPLQITFWMQIPNGIGTILGLVQLALYSYYSKISEDASREPLIVSYA